MVLVSLFDHGAGNERPSTTVDLITLTVG